MFAFIYWNLLEVKGQVGGDDANVEQVLHVLELTLLKVAENVQGLRETTTQGLLHRFQVRHCFSVWSWRSNWVSTSSAMSVLLYSKWCLSMMEEPWSLAKGDALLQKIKKRKIHVLDKHISLHDDQRCYLITLSGRGCWFLCGQYHGRKLQPPWQRHLDPSSTSSAFQSVTKQELVKLWIKTTDMGEHVYAVMVLPAVGRTWCGLHWNRASSCGRWWNGNPSSQCTSTWSVSYRVKRIIIQRKTSEEMCHWWKLSFQHSYYILFYHRYYLMSTIKQFTVLKLHKQYCEYSASKRLILSRKISMY